MEAKLALALILQRLEFECADGRPTTAVRETLTLKPDGFRLKVRRRAPGRAAATAA